MMVKPLVRPTGCEPVPASYKLRGSWLAYTTGFFGSFYTVVEFFPLEDNTSQFLIYVSQSSNEEKIHEEGEPNN
jgi:hypothetical protein